MNQPSFSFFISHSSATKELARRIYYNSIANHIYPWYDEGLLRIADDLDRELRDGIARSNGFLLLHSKAAMEKRWVPYEMELAEARYQSDPSFRLLVVKLDDHPLEGDFWPRFLYHEWNPDDQPGSIVKLLEAILNKKGIVGLTASSALTSEPSNLFVNKSASLAEHTRNFVLWNVGLIKQSLVSLVNVGREHEIRDTVAKILQLRLFAAIPGGHFPPVYSSDFVFLFRELFREIIYPFRPS